MATFYVDMKTGQQLSQSQLVPGQTYVTSGTGALYTAPAAPQTQQTSQPPQQSPASNTPANPSSDTSAAQPYTININYPSQPQQPTAQNTAQDSTQPAVSQAPQQTQAAQAQTAAQPYQQPGASGPGAPQALNYNGSIVDLLQSQGQPSDYTSRAQLAAQLGIQNYTGTASQNQQLAQKYMAAFQSGGYAGNQNAPAANPNQTIAAAVNPTSSDPVFSAYTSILGPVMASLGAVMQEVNNPTTTAQSLTSEYQQLQQQYNLPALQTQMMNMSNAMNWTEDDIRDEISAAGGGATESQVLAMSAARNKTILKQYNAVATQYDAANQQVQNIMQYASADQQTQLQREQITASISESMASIGAQVANMGMTMQKNVADNLNKIVSNVGYTGLAAQAAGNPQVLSYYEQSLGLAPGSLSDSAALQQMETYRQQQLALGQQRVTIQMYNAGMGIGGSQPTITTNPGGGSSTPGGLNVSASDLTRPSWLPSNYPIYLSSGQMQQVSSKYGFTQDPGTNNYIAPNVGYFVQNPDGSYYLNSALPQGTANLAIDKSYQQTVAALAQAQQTPVGGSPLNKGRYSRNANTALKNYIASPVYQNVANGAVYLSRIASAITNPGSISDLDLADSIIKINNGGGQVTEAQLQTYFQGQSYSDMFAIQGDKLTQKGGILSPQQRADLVALAQQTLGQYKYQYENLYVQAAQNLQGQGIPLNYLANLPDWVSAINGAKANLDNPIQ